ncbi:MAG: hypothetical protein H7329_16560 [Opitutaceae bacterium]|nr:hypothetical protein [Cytophagales bacterium]
MKSIFLILSLFGIAGFMQSCDFGHQQDKVDEFYTTKRFRDIPSIPLIKPLKLRFDRIPNKWYLEIPSSFKNQMNIDSVIGIGVEHPFVYGEIFPSKFYSEDYKNGDLMIVNNYNTVYGPNLSMCFIAVF